VDFLRVVGDRRSIRWFRPWQPVEREKVQRILEVARLTTCPGNLQPWRALVVFAREVDPEIRDALLAANNNQHPHALAPVWIYWYADPLAAVPDAFLARVRQLLATGVLPPAFGWNEANVEAMIARGEPAPAGLPPLDRAVHNLTAEQSVVLAVQETNGACVAATLAAVNEGLGTCLHSVAAPARQNDVKRLLGIPDRFAPVWIQLVGIRRRPPRPVGSESGLASTSSSPWGRGAPLSRGTTRSFGIWNARACSRHLRPFLAAKRSFSISPGCSGSTRLTVRRDAPAMPRPRLSSVTGRTAVLGGRIRAVRSPAAGPKHSGVPGRFVSGVFWSPFLVFRRAFSADARPAGVAGILAGHHQHGRYGTSRRHRANSVAESSRTGAAACGLIPPRADRAAAGS